MNDGSVEKGKSLLEEGKGVGDAGGNAELFVLLELHLE
jgi:hypothetical protein